MDSTAEYLCKAEWGELHFPPPFGRDALPEEAYIADLDAKSGASLKLTVLNPRGRIWTMVAGGGASVVYSDTICDLGRSGELANYGEYSGAELEPGFMEGGGEGVMDLGWRLLNGYGVLEKMSFWVFLGCVVFGCGRCFQMW